MRQRKEGRELEDRNEARTEGQTRGQRETDEWGSDAEDGRLFMFWAAHVGLSIDVDRQLNLAVQFDKALGRVRWVERNYF